MSEKKTTLPEAAAADGKETKIDVVAGNAKALVEQTTEDAAQEEENPLLLKLPEGKPPRLALVDGNRDPGLPVKTRLVVKGDATSAHIAAASVLAKVSRDRVMTAYAAQYPGYGWEKNKGYGSKEHYEGIARYGITPLHRCSFLKNLLEKHHDG